LVDGGASGAGVKKRKETPKETPKGGEVKGRRLPRPGGQRIQAPAWWTTNPSPLAAWKLPEGMSFNNFFDYKNEAMKANTNKFPRVKMHRPLDSTKKNFLCLKHQVVGSCKVHCRQAHIVPGDIPDAEQKIMDDAFKEICS
jgi:hypothetical protein